MLNNREKFSRTFWCDALGIWKPFLTVRTCKEKTILWSLVFVRTDRVQMHKLLTHLCLRLFFSCIWLQAFQLQVSFRLKHHRFVTL